MFNRKVLHYALGDNRLLNRKSKFINKCRHQKNLLLSDVFKGSKD